MNCYTTYCVWITSITTTLAVKNVLEVCWRIWYIFHSWHRIWKIPSLCAHQQTQGALQALRNTLECSWVPGAAWSSPQVSLMLLAIAAALAGSKGMVMVICPLKALQMDQVRFQHRLGIIPLLTKHKSCVFQCSYQYSIDWWKRYLHYGCRYQWRQ